MAVYQHQVQLKLCPPFTASSCTVLIRMQGVKCRCVNNSCLCVLVCVGVGVYGVYTGGW